MNKCEETNCLEDYFIDMDPACGKGDTFFGEIITTIEEGTAKSCNNVNFSLKDISELTNKYVKIFKEIYTNHNLLFSFPDTYVGVRYI